MANRRMISKDICCTDRFIDLPHSTRCLWYDLVINADDEGFIGNYKAILAMGRYEENDLRNLVSSNYIIKFSSGVIVIVHWWMCNNVGEDRLKKTEYNVERQMLTGGKSKKAKQNKAYKLKRTKNSKCVHLGDKVDPLCLQDVSIGK